jgi:hypothetical protein
MFPARDRRALTWLVSSPAFPPVSKVIEGVRASVDDNFLGMSWTAESMLAAAATAEERVRWNGYFRRCTTRPWRCGTRNPRRPVSRFALIASSSAHRRRSGGVSGETWPPKKLRFISTLDHVLGWGGVVGTAGFSVTDGVSGGSIPYRCWSGAWWTRWRGPASASKRHVGRRFPRTKSSALPRCCVSPAFGRSAEIHWR